MHLGADAAANSNIEELLFPTASKTQDVDRASETTKDSESETQSNPEEGDHCGVCELKIADTADRFTIDGTHVCGECYPIFQPSGFVQDYTVCLNPLCRRRWKLLTPKAMACFCPSCKKHVEEGIGCAQVSLDIEPMKRMYHLWFDIYSELAEILCLPKPTLARLALSVNTGTDAAQSAEEKRQQWHCLMQAIRTTFPDLPSADDVRNWNSLIARKVYYRGVVRRNNKRFACSIEARMEMHEDLKTAKRVPVGAREYHVLDWQQTLEEGEEVYFMAFPNPAANERDKVSKIVRVLTRDDGLELMQSKTSRPFVADSLGAGNEFDSMFQTGTDAASLGLADPDSPFAELMTWSQDQPKITQPKKNAKPGKNNPRSCKQLVGRPGCQPTKSVDSPQRNQPFPSTGSPVFNSSTPQTAVKLSVMQRRASILTPVFTKLQRRALICPLSPGTAYFGD